MLLLIHMEIILDSSKYFNVISIDIGMKNLAICRESFNVDLIGSLKCTPKKDRYTLNGEPTPSFSAFLDSFYKHGTTEWLDKKDITDDAKDKFVVYGKSKKKMRIIDNGMLLRLTQYLESIRKEIDKSDAIVIEAQLKTNPNAQILHYHIRSLFLGWYKDEKDIILFPSKNKTQVLGAPRKIEVDGKKVRRPDKGKNGTKGWACELAFKILNLRDDINTVHYIFSKNKSKKDDLSDVICQANSYAFMKLIDNISF